MSTRRKPEGFRVKTVSGDSGSRHSDEQSAIRKMNREKLAKLGLIDPDSAVEHDTASNEGDRRILSTASATEAVAEPTPETPVTDKQSAPADELNNQLAKLLERLTRMESAIAETTTKSEQKVQEVEQQSAQQIAEIQSKADAAIAAAKEEADKKASAIAADLESANKRVQSLEAAWKPRGNVDPTGGNDPVKMTVLGEGSQEMRNWEKLMDNAPKHLVTTNSGQYLHADLRSASSYWRKHKNSIRDGVEALMRDKGFFGGRSHDTQAITVASDIPSIAYNYLSTFIRESQWHDMIHHQFANYSAAPGTPPRLNTAVPRYPYRARPTAAADRELTPGTDISSSTDNVSELIALITIKELGLGKDQNNAPIGIAEFVNAFSMTNLESIVERNLAYDYQAYKDMLIYSQWFTTDRIVYNNAGTVTTTAGDIVTGSQGTITRDFLVSLRSYMKTLQIPTYRDGYYGLVLNPAALAQYMNDLTAQERFVSPDQADMVTRTLQAATGQEFGGVVSGYRGTHDGFHIFEQNIYGIGSPGDTGTQSVTFGTGVGARTCDTNFAFGADTVAWATALPVEIRPDDRTDFNRRSRFIWYSHEGCGELDIKSAVSGTQLRVVQVRNLRTPA